MSSSSNILSAKYIVSEGSVSVVGADVLESFLHDKYEYRHGAQRAEQSRAEHFQ